MPKNAPPPGQRMTWEAAKGRWRKIHRGKVFTYPAPSKSDRAAERVAWEAFETFRAEIDADRDAAKPHREEYETATEVRLQLTRWIADELAATERTGDVPTSEERDHPEPEEWRSYLTGWRDRLSAELRTLKREGAKVSPKPLDRPDTVFAWPFVGCADSEEKSWLRRLDTLADYRRLKGEAETPEDRTVRAAAARLLAEKGMTCKPSTVRRLSQRLDTLTAWRGADDLETITAAWLSDYRTHLLGEVKDGRSSEANAKEIMNAARGLVRWLYEREEIDRLPRNIQKVNVTAPLRKPETYPVGLLSEVVNLAPGRIRAWLLLLANCGCYVSDLAALELSEVDVHLGTITRRRTKTEGKKSAPTVTHVLWDATHEALLAELERRAEPQPGCESLALLTTEGGKLLYFVPSKNGKDAQRVDNVANTVKNWAKRETRIDVPTNLQRWRHTGATLLRNMKDFSDLAELWQANAPQGVTDRHYAAAPLARLADATAHLGTLYGFSTDPERLATAKARVG